MVEQRGGPARALLSGGVSPRLALGLCLQTERMQAGVKLSLKRSIDDTMPLHGHLQPLSLLAAHQHLIRDAEPFQRMHLKRPRWRSLER